MMTVILEILLNSFFVMADATMTQARFDQIIDEIQTTHQTELSAASPGGIRFVRHWDQDKMNGSASNINGNGVITLKGGVARNPLMNEDGFRAYACHEVGHIIGGEPRYRNRLPIYRNLSVECQADYHATSQCLRKLFTGKHAENTRVIAGLQVPPEVRDKCHQAHRGEQARAVCIRSAMAGYNFINAFANSRPDRGPVTLDFADPDKARMPITLDDYPSAQCRLDTLFQGALCADDCSQAEPGSLGARPNCWYARPANPETGKTKDVNR